MDKTAQKNKTNLGESIRQKLKNLSSQRNRPFDEILRYYAMERFLYRLSISQHAQKFFLKGGLMLKVFSNRGTPLEYPVAFNSDFYDLPESQKRWKKFLEMIGKEPI